MKAFMNYIKRDVVLTVSWVLAIVSMFIVHPNKSYAGYIDWRSLGILWSLMIITKGLSRNGFFEKIGHALLSKTKYIWQLVVVLVMLCFFSSMLITNDVALITFVPFAIMMLSECGRKDLMIIVIVLQTIAANLGSMLTPVGNPQNLYLYGLSGMSIGSFILLMLPLSAISFALLVISILLIKGKTERITEVEREIHMDEKLKSLKKRRIPSYLILFFIALLVVARLLPFYALVAVVLLVVLIIEPNVLIKVDYCLLATFVGFFIFTGNMGNVSAVSDALSSIVDGREVIVGVVVSQVISNVPAALLLSDFTGNLSGLIVGVNVGGLGTLIASMASLISFKLLAHTHNDLKGKYFVRFTITNVIYLLFLLGLSLLLH